MLYRLILPVGGFFQSYTVHRFAFQYDQRFAMSIVVEFQDSFSAYLAHGVVYP
jgi:hypothetical protein